MAKKLRMAKPGSISSRLSGVFRRIYYKRRLMKICKVLEITPYGWQEEFVLKDIPIRMPGGRCTGKTMAVVLRILVRGPWKGAFPLRGLALDPDACKNRYVLDATYCEYRRCYEVCNRAGLMKRQPPLPRPRSIADVGILDEMHAYGLRLENDCRKKENHDPRFYNLYRG